MLTLDAKKGPRERVSAAGKSGTVAAIDVGTTKVCCFIGKPDTDVADGRLPLRIAGIGHQVSHGVRKGAVTDMEQVEDAVRAAVETAERMAGTTIKRAVVSLNAGHPKSQIVNVGTSVAGRPVTDDDLRRILRFGRKQSRTDGRTVVHAIPISYTIDDNKGIRDPRGMFGERLSVRMHVVTAETAAIRNLAMCIERCHLELGGLVLAPYGSGLATLVDDESELGTVCLDMGGGTTSISVFSEGMCVYADVVPFGGVHVTQDIARGLSTPLSTAERLKTLYGSALASSTDDREIIDVPQMGEDSDTTSNHVPRSLLTGIIKPRVEEIFEHVRDRLAESKLESICGKRMVLTGGASQLTGVRELAAQVFEKNVRLARPIKITGIADAAGGPAFASCAGLLSYAASAPAEAISTETEFDKAPKERGNSFFGLSRWLKLNL